MLFIRIIGNGYDKNGNYKYKIVGYRQDENDAHKYDYWSVDQMQQLGIGRINRASHSMSTTLYKFQILETLQKKIGVENYNYIFE